MNLMTVFPHIAGYKFDILPSYCCNPTVYLSCHIRVLEQVFTLKWSECQRSQPIASSALYLNLSFNTQPFSQDGCENQSHPVASALLLQ